MSAHCCDHTHERSAAAANSPTYRRILWVALSLNLAMFFVEIGANDGEKYDQLQPLIRSSAWAVPRVAMI